MKVETQYEVLETKQKDTCVPRGTIETIGFWSRTRLSECQHRRSSRSSVVVLPMADRPGRITL
jgi:hypothetical protein